MVQEQFDTLKDMYSMMVNGEKSWDSFEDFYKSYINEASIRIQENKEIIKKYVKKD